MDFHNAYIIEFENAFPDTLCDEFIHFYDTNKIDYSFMLGKDGHISELKKYKSSTDVPVNLKIKEQVILNNKYQNIIKTLKHKYADILIEKGLDKKPYDDGEYNIAPIIKNSKQSDLMVQKSEVGQYYKWHSDWIPGKDRILACILYLNTLEDDAGGNTHFLSGKVIKPKKGKVVIFPCTLNYLHMGDTLKKDFKYIITTFSSFDFEIEKKEQKKSYPFFIKR